MKQLEVVSVVIRTTVSLFVTSNLICLVFQAFLLHRTYYNLKRKNSTRNMKFVMDGVLVESGYYGFLKRHHDVSLRTPEYISSKKRSVTENDVREWYEKVCVSFEFIMSCSCVFLLSITYTYELFYSDNRIYNIYGNGERYD